MGVSEFSRISYNLCNFIQSFPLEYLDEEFSLEEISYVVKNLPNNHAPGPNGFNGLFIKKCWDIIK
jgi:hypothetical protein